jgi:hypothetical protein
MMTKPRTPTGKRTFERMAKPGVDGISVAEARHILIAIEDEAINAALPPETDDGVTVVYYTDGSRHVGLGQTLADAIEQAVQDE